MSAAVPNPVALTAGIVDHIRTRPDVGIWHLLDGSEPCAQTDPELFFPEKGEPSKAARTLCLGLNGRPRCPMFIECLRWAVHNNPDYGVWAGTTQRDRTAIRAALGITSAKPDSRPLSFDPEAVAKRRRRAEAKAAAEQEVAA